MRFNIISDTRGDKESNVNNIIDSRFPTIVYFSISENYYIKYKSRNYLKIIMESVALAQGSFNQQNSNQFSYEEPKSPSMGSHVSSSFF